MSEQPLRAPRRVWPLLALPLAAQPSRREAGRASDDRGNERGKRNAECGKDRRAGVPPASSCKRARCPRSFVRAAQSALTELAAGATAHTFLEIAPCSASSCAVEVILTLAAVSLVAAFLHDLHLGFCFLRLSSRCYRLASRRRRGRHPQNFRSAFPQPPLTLPHDRLGHLFGFALSGVDTLPRRPHVLSAR